jgi:WD40 repeat protein
MKCFNIYSLLFLLLFISSSISRAQNISEAPSGHSSFILAVAIDPKGEYIVSGSDDKTVKIWELETGKLVNTLKGHSSSVRAVAIDPKGEYIVSGSDDGTVKVWDLKIMNESTKVGGQLKEFTIGVWN